MLTHAACKDAHPLDTVRRIKAILSTHGIETDEQWNESGVPYCHSVRVRIAGTPFGANGKGITQELALASGYGELMERLQLGYLVKNDWQKGSLLADGSDGNFCLSIGELLNNGLYSVYTDAARRATGTELTQKELLNQYADAQGQIPVTGYYSVATGDEVYLPTMLRRAVYTTNGCAAGNTMEEAMVQAISEIVERHFKGRILAEGIPVPDIDEEALQNCPIAYEIISFLRENDFRVTVKDCSLGTKFPVVCVCLVDRRTGRYHTHFGAFPNFEIALQRTLTESFQGRTLAQIGQYADFCPGSGDSQDLRYLMNELVKGTSEKCADFFLNTAGVRKPTAGFSGTTNRALLKECLAFLQDQDLQVLVRDCSCLGFPTCQVIIPGYSEIFPHRLSPRHNDTRYVSYAKKVLQDPASAGPDALMGLLMHLSQSQANDLGRSFLAEANLAAELTPREDAFLLNTALAHVHYTLGKHGEVLKAIQNALAFAAEPDAEYLICLKRYLTLSREGRSAHQVRAVLEHFHRPATVTLLYELLASKKNPFDPVTLHCGGNCGPHCRLYAACRKSMSDQLSALVNEKQSALPQTALYEMLRAL